MAGILGILNGCGSLVIPVLYKLGGKTTEAMIHGDLGRIELFCPRCGSRETYPIGEITCNNCSLEITVGVSDEHPDAPGSA